MNYYQQQFSQFSQFQQPSTMLQANSNQTSSPLGGDFVGSYSPQGIMVPPLQAAINGDSHTQYHSFQSQSVSGGHHQPHTLSSGGQHHLSSMGSGSANAALDDQRKQDILKKLQQEREMRRKYVQEGRADEFQLQTLSANSMGALSARGGQTLEARDESSIKKNHEDNNNSQVQMYLRHGMMSEQLNSHRHNPMMGNSDIRNSYERYSEGHQNLSDNSRVSIDNRKELVHKLLNDRKADKSRSSISQQSQSYSHQQQQQPPYQFDQFSNNPRQEFGYQESSASPNDNFGGFNPEALYQEDVIQEDNQQQQPSTLDLRQGPTQHNPFSATSQSSSLFCGVGNTQQSYDDRKYRDAVEYAKAQIQKELHKKQQRNQLYDEPLVSYPSDRMSAALSQVNQQLQKQQQPYHQMRESSNEHEQERKVPQSQMQYEYLQGTGLPPSVKNLDRELASRAHCKAHEEMNHKNQRQSQTRAHHFTYDTAAEEPKKKQFRPHSASINPPDYLKNTVAADLKLAKPPTIAKTKQVVTDHQKKFQDLHTFKPQILDYQLPASKELSKEERWKKLTEPKTSEVQKRERIKAQLEIEETQKVCTFKPQVSSSVTRSAKKTQNPLYDLPLAERLMHEADLRKEKREKLKREMDQEQMKDCSFKPKILGGSQSLINMNKFNSQTPIHERVNDLQKEKNEKLQKLRMQSEQEQSDLTFQPQVNKKSAKIATVKREAEESKPMTVVDRLYKDANTRIEKNLHHSQSVHDQLNRDYSFQPHISKSSQYMSEKSDLFNGNLKDFYDRQQAFVQKQLEKKEEQKQKYSQEAKCSFRPEINLTSEIIVESDPSRGGETDQDRYHRLSKKDHKRQEVVRELLEKELYDQYTYKPVINKVSQTLVGAKERGLEELAYNPKGREIKERLASEILTKEVSDCTFRPQTTQNKKFKGVQSDYSMADCSNSEEYSKKLKDKLREKQERIAHERRQRDYDQLKDCTFKPQVLDTTSTSKDQVVVVRGLGRHLELKELQKKKEEEKRLREAEVFGVANRFAPFCDELDINNPQREQIIQMVGGVGRVQPGGYTVPQPFELSHVGKEEKRNRVLKELKEKEMSECTFKPATNEGRNRKLIKEIMDHKQEQENQMQYFENKENGQYYLNQ